MSKKIVIYKSTVAEDLMLCAAAVYVASVANFDEYLPEKLSVIIRWGSVMISWLCWLGMSFFNGLRLRKSFAAGFILWNWLPPVITLAINSVKGLKFSDIGLVAVKAAEVLWQLPYREIEKLTGVSAFGCTIILSVLCLLLFGAGYIYTKKIILSGDGS